MIPFILKGRKGQFREKEIRSYHGLGGWKGGNELLLNGQRLFLYRVTESLEIHSGDGHTLF